MTMTFFTLAGNRREEVSEEWFDADLVGWVELECVLLLTQFEYDHTAMDMQFSTNPDKNKFKKT